MNRKAKIAYFHLIIGFLLFFSGIVAILNYTLNDDDYQTSNDDTKKINITQIIMLASSSSSAAYSLSSKSKSKINQAKSDQNDLYVYWYCQMRYEENEDHYEPVTLAATKTITPATTTHEPANNQDHNNNNNHNGRTTSYEYFLQIKFIKSTILNNFFSFLICSTDKIYLIFIIFVTVFGGFLLVYGCVRFYQYDIRLMRLDASSMDSNTNSIEQDLSTTMADSESKGQLLELCSCCCFCCMDENKQSSAAAKSTKEKNPVDFEKLYNSMVNYNKTFRSLTSQMSFDTTLNNGHAVPLDPAYDKRRSLAAERMCPFIYDDLPAFMLDNRRYNLVFPPPPVARSPTITPQAAPIITSPKLPASKPPTLNLDKIKSNAAECYVNDLDNELTTGCRSTLPTSASRTVDNCENTIILHKKRPNYSELARKKDCYVPIDIQYEYGVVNNNFISTPHLPSRSSNTNKSVTYTKKSSFRYEQPKVSSSLSSSKAITAECFL